MSEETEKGKEWAERTFKCLLENHRNKNKVERYFWKTGTNLFCIQVYGVDKEKYIGFSRELLDDAAHSHNTRRRYQLEKEILAALDGLG